MDENEIIFKTLLCATLCLQAPMWQDKVIPLPFIDVETQACVIELACSVSPS